MALGIIKMARSAPGISRIPSPEHLPRMVNGKGPVACLWIFVKGIPGKACGLFFCNRPPWRRFDSGCLAAVHRTGIVPYPLPGYFLKELTPSPGHLLYSCPCTCRCVLRCGTTAEAASPRTPRNTSRSGKAGSSARALFYYFAVLACCANRHTPTSTRSTGFCAIWTFISPSSSSSSTGSVGGAAEVITLETALGLNQAASQDSQPVPAAAAAGPPAADGGSGGGTNAQVIELAREISRWKLKSNNSNEGAES